jgi:hypothetical protein
MGCLCRKNAMVAADLYLQRYPNRWHIFIFYLCITFFLQNELALIVGRVVLTIEKLKEFVSISP